MTNVAERFIDGQAGTDRRSHGLLDEMRLGGTGTACRFGDGALFDGGDRRGHTDHHPRPVEPIHADTLQQEPDHALRDLEISDGAPAQRAYGDDVARRATDHLPRLMPHGQHLLGAAVESDHRGFVQHDSFAAHIDQCVGGSEIYGEIAGHQWSSSGERDRSPGASVDPRVSAAASSAAPPTGPGSRGRMFTVFIRRRGCGSK
jgi:hypothetical protein